MTTQLRTRFIFLPVILLLAACQTISPFNATAYEQATSLKVDALVLMDKATEPFANHAEEVDSLKLNLEKAYEYAKGQPKNVESTEQLKIIKDPARKSLGGFLRRWQDESVLRAPFIEEAKKLVSDGFDQVIELESGKRKPGESQ